MFVLQLACNAFHGSISRWTRNWHHYFCHSLHHICCDGVAHFTSGAHFGLPSPMSLLSLNHFAFNQLQLRRQHFWGEWQPCFVRVNHANHIVFLFLSCRVFGCPRSSRPGVSSQRPLAPSTRSTLVSTVTSDFETSSASLDRCSRVRRPTTYRLGFCCGRPSLRVHVCVCACMPAYLF